MTKKEAIFIIVILIILLCLGLIFQNQKDCPFCGKKAVASQTYLPKADLIKGSGPEVYVLENGVRHWIPDPEVFESFRYNWANIKTMTDTLLGAYPLGDKLSKYSPYPEGSLLRGSGPEVYLIELGKRRWIPNPEIFEKSNFGWKYIIDIDDKKLEKIKQGEYLVLGEPNRYPETIILDGPEQKEVLEITEITFKYSGTNPLGPNNDLSFETYLVGYDKKWFNQGSRYTKTYKLSEQSKVYTFYVRAKNKQGYFDPSPAAFSFQIDVSPYYQQVQINRVRAKEKDFQKDYLVIQNKDKETINITGWTIGTFLAKVAIPQAVGKLTHPFSANDQTDLRLAEREEVIISVGLSPRGINFRTNKCTGYLDQLSHFYPSLDERCPRLDESEYRHLKNACRDFIKKLGRCQIPDYSDEPAVNLDSQCTQFLNEKFSYKQCYEDYHQEMDFFEDEWRVFLKRSIDIFDNDGDTIILRDKSGLVVDEYSY